MKKNKSNFKKAIDELLNPNGSGSSEAYESEDEQETDFEPVEAQDIQESAPQEFDRSERQDFSDLKEEASSSDFSYHEDTAKESTKEETLREEETTPAPKEEKPVYEAIITPDVIINGNIIAGSNLRILGKIFGNVDCEGAIVLSGNIEGDVNARNLQFTAGGIQGNVSIREDILTDKGTQVRGDVSAKTAVLSGNMEGELLVRGDLELRSTSTVLGNIKARAISINSGSRIKGMMDVGGDLEETVTEYEE